jgi:membrane protein implicated in regulation of membrane protease activity
VLEVGELRSIADASPDNLAAISVIPAAPFRRPQRRLHRAIRYKDFVLSFAVGLGLLFVLPAPWNWVGFAVACVWQACSLVYGVRWSRRHPPLVGTSTLIGRSAVVVEPCRPRGRVRIGGETWQARSRVVVDRGARVRICSVEGITVHVEPVQSV